jgi:hypothetical protein
LVARTGLARRRTVVIGGGTTVLAIVSVSAVIVPGTIISAVVVSAIGITFSVCISRRFTFSFFIASKDFTDGSKQIVFFVLSIILTDFSI